jgi:cardiolipin synthase
MIIIDGNIGYVGGINVSDRYDNSIDTGLYWRDTHVRITGPAVLGLQRYFLINWNVAQDKEQHFDKNLFTEADNQGLPGLELVQIIGGGPIYPMSNIMLTYFRIFTLAQKKLYITNPYFIPSDSILDALKQAAMSGVDVRLIMPEKSDSGIVGAASKFYFMEMLQAGVRIFLYKKGFVHAKTVVADTRLSVVGTANMDIRSFDLNFEIMSVIYGENFGKQLEDVYLEDLKECREVTYAEWQKSGTGSLLKYAVARLISSFL